MSGFGNENDLSGKSQLRMYNIKLFFPYKCRGAKNRFYRIIIAFAKEVLSTGKIIIWKIDERNTIHKNHQKYGEKINEWRKSLRRDVGVWKKISGRITSLFYFITSNQNDIIFKIPSTLQNFYQNYCNNIEIWLPGWG